MNITKVSFDGQTFLLDPDQNLSETKRAIVSAARDGSDFVDFRTIGHGTVSLLVTPHVPVRIQIIDRTEEQIDRMQAEPPPIDASEWKEWDY
ncbi:hypothetical protein [Microbacterium sp. W4I20]|uniref:hypothetical protein n=1 Tax=Microbacterium sp. W4I20 TaxID=3042262 RepID=UPI0027842A2C|nr:hypothetical protein [Microbacterium sp. W4I20]MDQ0729113.1 hypothetical protein [Microbacterium sp. W4I20]